MKKFNFNLHTKIVVGVLIILTFTTSFNLIYSYMTFNSDKSSYLYETVLRKSELILNLIDFYVEKVKDRALTNQILISHQGSAFEDLINEEKNTILVGQVNAKDPFAGENIYFTNKKNISVLETRTGIKPDELKKIIGKYLADQNTVKDYNTVHFYTNSNEIIFGISLFKKENSPTVLVSVFDSSEMNKYLQNDSIYTNKIFFTEEKIAKNLPGNDWVKYIDYKKFKHGSTDVTLDQKSKLLSYSVSGNKYIVASYIDKDNALRISKFLILKSLLFSLTLLGISIAIGIFFASSLSFPLKQLTAAADAVAKGNYNQNIDIRTSDELGLLSKSFNSMSKEIKSLLSAKEDVIKKLEKAKVQLEKYSSQLESMVEQRTIELKKVNEFMAAMVDSLDQGLFVFNKNLVCNDVATKACEDIFDVKPAGKTLSDVLNVQNQEEKENIQQWGSIIFSEMIPFQSAVELGPVTRSYGSVDDQNFKHVKIQYYPMKDETDALANIVAVATNDTNEIRAVKKAKEQEDYVSMILKIIKNKIRFQSFCMEVEGIFQGLQDLCENPKNLNLEMAMIYFHTLNGGFGLYFMKALQLKAREIEGEILAVKQEPPMENYHVRLEENIETLRNQFHLFLINLDANIGTNFSKGEKTVEISRKVLEDFKAIVEKSDNQVLRAQYYENFMKESIGQFFNIYNDLCKNLAVTLGKKFNGIEFKGEQLKIDAQPLSDFLNNLVHLFRNCMDHGLEDPSTRLASGKTEAGTISVSFDIIEKDKTFLNVIISDDGRGIDPEIIKRKYQQLNPDFKFDTMRRDDIINLIFDPFFSTKDESTLVSGRGVGMSAIKEAVERLNGQIAVISEVGKGSSFKFTIPLA